MGKSPIDSELLVEQIKAKNSEALAYLFDHYSDAIYGIIFRILQENTIAEEVLQDAFLKFWERIDHYDATKGRLFTWMANLSRNLAIDKLRSKELKRSAKTDDISSYVSEEEGQQPKIDQIGMSEVVKKLREEERFVVETIYFRGYTQSEVSEEFNIPLGTVKTRLRMGLISLRKMLGVS